MLNNFFSKPLTLTIGSEKVSFTSIEDFEFCISSKISVPSKKILGMGKFTVQQLTTEAEAIKTVEKRFVAILSRAIEKPASISRALRELDDSMFSQDNAWRDIIAALNEAGDEFDPLRRIALVKYMQYLSSRHDVIKHLYSEKRRGTDDEQQNGDLQQGQFRETLTFEDALFEKNAELLAQDFARLPKGESLIIKMIADENVFLILSKHKCNIKINGQQGIIYFTGPGERRHILATGRNAIGRGSKSTVVLDPNLSDISRLHLVIENQGNNTLSLTDFSAHGTYIPTMYLQ